MTNAVLPRSFLRRALPAGIAILLVLCVTVAHQTVTAAGDNYTGLLAPLDRLFDLTLASLVTALAFTVGYTLHRRMGLAFHSLAEELAICTIGGVGVLGMLLLLLGLLGLFNPTAIITLLLALTLINRSGLKRLYEVLAEGLGYLMGSHTKLLLAAGFSLIVTLLLWRAALPPYSPDELIYHLVIPQRFLAEGAVAPDPYNQYSNMPLLLQLIYSVFLIADADSAARIFSALVAILTALGLYAFCARFLDRRVGWIALYTFFAAGMVVEVATTTRIDVSLAGMLFLATHALFVHLSTRTVGWLYASALLSGFAIGIKLTAGLWVAMLALPYLWERWRDRGSSGIQQTLRQGLAYTLIVATLASPWLIKNAIWFHNPVYPFVSGEALERTQEGVRYFGKKEASAIHRHFTEAKASYPQMVAEIEGIMASYKQKRPDRHPYRFWEYFSHHDRYVMATPILHTPNYLFIVAPLFLFLLKSRQLAWLGMLALGFFLISTSNTWIARFLLPVYPPLTLISAYTITRLYDCFDNTPTLIRHMGGILISLFTLAATLPYLLAINLIVLNHINAHGYVTGKISRAEFMQTAFPQSYSAANYINHYLPDNARPLLFGIEMSYPIKKEYVPQPAWDVTTWRRALVNNATLEGVHEELKREGITHILYSPQLFYFVARTGREGSAGVDSMYPDVLETGTPDYFAQVEYMATFQAYSRKYLKLVYFDDWHDFTIYALN